MEFELNKESELSLKLQIYRHIKEWIMSGQLTAAEALPSTRELAKELGISRNTVGEAYDMLLAEGYVINRQGAATRVADGLCLQKTDAVEAKQKRASQRVLRADFRTGRPDLRQFPLSLWQRVLHQVSFELPIEQYGYTGPSGLPELRRELVAWLFRSRGLAVSPDDIFITAGATHALHVLTDLLCGDGRKVLVEDPCHSGMLQVFRNKGNPVIPVPVDAEGMQTACLQGGPEACAVYVTPSHQFPLGGILPAARRATLIRYAREHGLYIMEDDYDSEFRYSGEPIAPLYAMDPQRVIYIGTFSKSLFPALRVGYIILPEPLHKGWKKLRTHTDVQNPPIEQAALAELLRTRKLDRHVRRMRRLYGGRRQVLLEALSEKFGKGWVAYGDAAGLHVAIDFPGRHFDESFRQRVLECGIAVTPAEHHCLESGRHSSKLILGYGHLEPQEIRSGVQVLYDYLMTPEGCNPP